MTIMQRMRGVLAPNPAALTAGLRARRLPRGSWQYRDPGLSTFLAARAMCADKGTPTAPMQKTTCANVENHIPTTAPDLRVIDTANVAALEFFAPELRYPCGGTDPVDLAVRITRHAADLSARVGALPASLDRWEAAHAANVAALLDSLRVLSGQLARLDSDARQGVAR